MYLFHAEFSSWIDFQAVLSDLAAGALSFGLCYLVPGLGSNLLALVVKLAVFSLAPLLRAVSHEDIEVLGGASGIILAYERLFASHSKGLSDAARYRSLGYSYCPLIMDNFRRIVHLGQRHHTPIGSDQALVDRA